MLDKMAEPEKLDGYLNMVTYSDDWVDFTFGRIEISGTLLSRRVAKDAVGKFVKEGLGLDPQMAAAYQERADDGEEYFQRVELDLEVFQKYFLS